MALPLWRQRCPGAPLWLAQARSSPLRTPSPGRKRSIGCLLIPTGAALWGWLPASGLLEHYPLERSLETIIKLWQDLGACPPSDSIENRGPAWRSHRYRGGVRLSISASREAMMARRLGRVLWRRRLVCAVVAAIVVVTGGVWLITRAEDLPVERVRRSPPGHDQLRSPAQLSQPHLQPYPHLYPVGFQPRIARRSEGGVALCHLRGATGKRRLRRVTVERGRYHHRGRESGPRPSSDDRGESDRGVPAGSAGKPRGHPQDLRPAHGACQPILSKSPPRARRGLGGGSRSWTGCGADLGTAVRSRRPAKVAELPHADNGTAPAAPDKNENLHDTS